MKPKSEGRHLADKRAAPTGSRTARFLKLSRNPRDTFHKAERPAGASRLIHFLRIARGQTA